MWDWKMLQEGSGSGIDSVQGSERASVSSIRDGRHRVAA